MDKVEDNYYNVSLPTSSRGDAVTLHVCITCGSIVSDRYLHAEWHEEQK